MAGDWIKMQKDTPDKPEVLAIAARLGIDSDAVVGKLVRVWSWFDTHTTDGNADGVTYSFVDRISGVTGFAEQMALVGWLSQSGHTLSLPNFDYHTGETAKKRALGKNRASKHRSNAESNADGVTEASPEKRREEKKEYIHPPTPRKRGKAAAPQSVSADRMVEDGVDRTHAEEWLLIRARKKLVLTETAWSDVKAQAQRAGLSIGDAIKTAVVNSWGGFRADWLGSDSSAPSKQAKPGTDEYFALHKDADWWRKAGFATVWDAANARCWHHNADQFADGKRVQEAA